jgi:hypothetical protein
MGYSDSQYSMDPIDTPIPRRKERRITRKNAFSLSRAYKMELGKPVSQAVKEKLSLEDGASYAEAIARQVVHKAIGMVKDDELDFCAIKELRETTEGKTADKIIAAGTNSELENLAKIMAGEPAKPDGEEDEATVGDDETESAEEAFHAD